jgi:translocator protein
MTTNPSKLAKLLPLILLSVAAFGLNNLFQIPEWYDELQAKAWTLNFQQVDVAEVTLYALTSVAFWLIWKDRSLSEITWTAFAYFFVILFASVWSLLFFGMQSPLAAFIDMIAVTGAIVVAMLQFFKYDRTAGYIMLPCLVGALFFAVNNFHLYQVYLEVTSA